MTPELVRASLLASRATLEAALVQVDAALMAFDGLVAPIPGFAPDEEACAHPEDSRIDLSTFRSPKFLCRACGRTITGVTNAT